MNGRIIPSALLWLPVALLTLMALGGCDLGSKGDQAALYTLPKGRTILVLVDAHPGSSIPVDVPNALAEGIMRHLYTYNAGDKFVNPQKVLELGPERMDFAKYDVRRIARETGADLVLSVDLFRFRAVSASGDLLTEGIAEAKFCVTDSDGNRLWPGGESLKFPVISAVTLRLADDQDIVSVRKQLIEDLTVRIGRTFHKYSKDDKYLAR